MLSALFLCTARANDEENDTIKFKYATDPIDFASLQGRFSPYTATAKIGCATAPMHRSEESNEIKKTLCSGALRKSFSTFAILMAAPAIVMKLINDHAIASANPNEAVLMAALIQPTKAVLSDVLLVAILYANIEIVKND